MKRNRIILMIVIIILILTSIILLVTPSTGTLKSRDKDFSVRDTASIHKIFLAKKDGSMILLDRQETGKWKLNEEYEASTYLVNLLLETMCRIRAEQPLPKAAVENIIKRLSVVATKVEIYGTAHKIDFLGLKWFPYEKMIKCYYIGDVTQDNLGTYMLMDGSDMPFVVSMPGFRGYVAARYQLKLDEWRDHSIFRLNANDIASVKVENRRNADESFIVDASSPTRKFAFTTLEGNPVSYVIDSLKIYNYLNSFKRVNAETFITLDTPEQTRDSIINSAPYYNLEVKQRDGQTHSISFYPLVLEDYMDEKTGEDAVSIDRAYAWDGRELMMIQYFTFDKILRNRSYFYMERPKR
ncbi:MAG: DUF4340 domain-containing protein [Bacteroidales bacterium]|nr:DUF4340 domain-containing protein [Bacteroidales bacterium]